VARWHRPRARRGSDSRGRPRDDLASPPSIRFDRARVLVRTDRPRVSEEASLIRASPPRSIEDRNIDRVSSNISSSTFASDLRHPPTRRRRRFCNLNNDPDFDTCEAPQEIDNDEIDVLLNAQEAAEEKRAAEAAVGRDVVCEPVAAANIAVRLPPIRPRSRGARDSLRTDFSRRHSSPALPSQRTFDR
jgi:hypothetical protein